MAAGEVMWTSHSRLTPGSSADSSTFWRPKDSQPLLSSECHPGGTLPAFSVTGPCLSHNALGYSSERLKPLPLISRLCSLKQSLLGLPPLTFMSACTPHPPEVGWNLWGPCTDRCTQVSLPSWQTQRPICHDSVPGQAEA